jgi:hypothetical protein
MVLMDSDIPISNVLRAEGETEQEMIDSLQFSGFPQDEVDRRKRWLALPRPARAAVRRVRGMIGPAPKSVMVAILHGARADKELIDAVESFRRESCESVSALERSPPARAPSPYISNRELIIN